MKPKTNPKTGLTSPVMENKDRKVLADAKDRLLLYCNWQGDNELAGSANKAISGINSLLLAHANGEKGGDCDGDSDENESEE